MEVLSEGRFLVASSMWQPQPGVFALTVVCKSTHVLAPNGGQRVERQEEIVEADDYWDDDARRSLRAGSDLVPFKLGAEVVLVGHAYAPRGQTVASLTARLVVGRIDKSLAIVGDRAFGPDGEPGEPAPFQRMSLRWERAAGGPGTANPVGVTPARAPNLLRAGAPPARRGEVQEPVGFGPLAPWWPGRAARLREHAAGWDHRRWFDRPLPPGIDAAYFSAAPPDQQLPELRGDERIVLENLHPEYPELVMTLAVAAPAAVVEREDGSTEPVALRWDTLRIDTDQRRCSLVSRGIVVLRHPHERGRVVVSAAPPRVSPPADASGPADVTLAPALTAVVPRALPFQPREPPLAAAAPDGEDGLDLAPADETIAGPLVAAPSRPLPFQPGRSALAVATPIAASPRRRLPPSDEEITQPPLASRPAPLPFAGVSPRPPAPQPLVPPALVPVAERQAAAPVEGPPPAPPPLIGPLATAEMVARGAAPPEPPPAVGATAPAPVAPEPARPGLPLDRYPIERCAAIAASIAMRWQPLPDILETNALDAALWATLRRHWSDAISADLDRGKATLLEVYDGAHVARIEAMRGPITVEEYARLTVAQERGRATAALWLSLPAGAEIRIKRVWTRRLTGDPALRRRLQVALQAARQT